MNTAQVLSTTKREKLKKAARLEKRQKLRDSLPVLNTNQIRRVRGNYYDALILDLEEAGFVSTSEFLNQLIQFQDQTLRQSGPDSVVWTRPRLIDSKEQLDLLYEKLRIAETAHYSNEIGNECDELINLGVKFALGSEDWWWLGEQLLIQAVNVSKTYQKDGGRREATSRYILGKFLLESILDRSQAQAELTAARQQSTGKTWTAMREMGQKQDTIFVESCKLLYKALLADARDAMKDDPLKAARICAIARKRAFDACDHEADASALMLQGQCELEAGDANAAIISFGKVLTFHTKANRLEGVCEARIHLAFAYLRIGYAHEILHQLETLLHFAEENNLPYYVGQALRFLGEFHLYQGEPNIATGFLIRALDIFHDIQDFENREQAKNLAAVSAGQELIIKYTKLILKCGKKDKRREHLIKLVKWKNSRETFWSEDEEQSTDSTQEESNHSVTSKKETDSLHEKSEEGEDHDQTEYILDEIEI